MQPGQIINTHRPNLGASAFVRMASRLSSPGHCPNFSAQGRTIPAGYRRLNRAEVQLHPGEGSA